MPRCQAQTLQGRACRRVVPEDQPFCYQHVGWRQPAQVTPAPAIDFRPFVRDGQNVHTSVTRTGLIPIFRALHTFVQRDPATFIGSWDTLKEILERQFRAYIKRRHPTPRWLRFLCVCFEVDLSLISDLEPHFLVQLFDMDDRPIRIEQIIAYAVSAAVVLNRQALWTRICEELYDGRNVCGPGKAWRLLNAFSGFEDLIGAAAPADPRSRNERLGDLFSALARRGGPVEELRAEATRILDAEGVMALWEREAWIQAL